MQELLESIRRNAVGLALFAIVTAGAIALAQVSTQSRIERNIQQAAAKALNEIIPADQYDNDLLTDTLPLNSFDTAILGDIADDAKLHIARNAGRVTSLILPVITPDGYTTDIRMIVGIHIDGTDMAGTLAGVRVLEHKETPGLGDKIDRKKSTWIDDFIGKSLTQPNEAGWNVKKDGGEFDQFTGATITPRAVVHAVKRALIFFEDNKEQLILNARAATNNEGNR